MAENVRIVVDVPAASVEFETLLRFIFEARED